MALIDETFFTTHMEQLGLKATFSPKEEQLDELIQEASEWVEDYLRRRIDPTEMTEVLRGRGYHRLLLDEWPITEIVSIDWADDGGSTGEIDPALVRILPHGAIEFLNFNRPTGPWLPYRTYTIVYAVGMDPIPTVIKRATALKVVDLFSPMYQGARDTRLVEFVSNIQEMIVDLLEKYRRDRAG